MVAYKAWEFDKLLVPRRTPPKAVLIFGTDEGVISSRVQALLQHWLGKPNYREDVISIDADEILSSPDALANALNSQSLFGGTQAVHARIGTKNIAPALESALVSGTHPLLIQGAELNPNHAVRKFCEQNDHIIALPCYPENEKDIERTLTNIIQKSGIAIDKSAQELLLSLLSSNPQISKIEMEKLFLYATKKNFITEQDIFDVMIDLNDHSIDEFINALFSGHYKQALSLCDTLLMEGTHPSVLALLIMRHSITLLKIHALRSSGQSFDAIFKSFQPPIYPKRQAAIQEQLKKVSRGTLLKLEHLSTQALRDTRSSGTQSSMALYNLLNAFKA